MNTTGVYKSYATFGLGRSFRQILHAFSDRRMAEENMALLYQFLQGHESVIRKVLGRPVENMDILEIGPGQGMERARYFGLKNRVTGIDLDVVPRGLDLGGYARMLRTNGLGRLLKTIGRQVILSGANARGWEKAVGAKGMRYPEVIHADICHYAPQTSAYDLALSWSVFEHLPDPRSALQNIIATLRPGGGFLLSIHLFSSHNGHHDIRAFTGGAESLPLWGHLRQETARLFHPSAYLNRWRLAEWRSLFAEFAPGATEVLEAFDVPERYGRQLTPALCRELDGFSDEELFTVNAIYVWKKPWI